MTQEEKAKAYDKAIEKIKYVMEHGVSPTLNKEDLQGIFPELAESEDELTWLTKYIEEEAYSLSIDIRDNEDRIKLKNLQRSLAWLEKQDEKPADTKIMWHDVSEEPEEMKELLVEWDSEDATWHEVAFYGATTKSFNVCGKQLEGVTRWCYIDNLIEKQGEKEKFIKKELSCIRGYRENAIKRLKELEKQGEQKPIDLKDLEMCRDLIQGGAKVAVQNNDRGVWMLPINESLKLSLIASIQGRIDEINEELEDL